MESNHKTRRSLINGTIILIVGFVICYLAIGFVKGDTLQMAILSLGALTMIAGGIIMLFGRR